MADYFKRVQSQTATKFWINNVTENEAHLAIDAGACGCTQNPSYTWKMLNHPTDSSVAKAKLTELLKEEKDDDAVMLRLQRSLVGDISDIFMPMYEASHGKAGYVSIQGNPFKEDVDSILKAARFNREANPNIMAKVPVTVDGLKAIEILASERVPINATECMAIRQVLDVCEVYERVTKNMKDPAPLYFSLITGIFDQYLQQQVSEKHIDVSQDALWQAGMCVAKKVHSIVKERKYKAGFIGGGARGLQHFTEMVGADASITINWIGTADKLIELDQPVLNRFFAPVSFSAVDELTEKLADFKRAYFIHAIEPEEYEEYGPVVLFRSSFEKSWASTMKYIAEAREVMMEGS